MTNLIHPDDTLLTFDRTRMGQEYIGESTTLGKTYTIDMLLDEPTDSCHRIVVFNTKTLKGSDVTELFAAAWLKREDALPSGVRLGDEPNFPAYVRDSRAWAIWRDDLEAERPIEDADTANAIRRDHVAISRPRPGLNKMLGGVR